MANLIRTLIEEALDEKCCKEETDAREETPEEKEENEKANPNEGCHK